MVPPSDLFIQHVFIVFFFGLAIDFLAILKYLLSKIRFKGYFGLEQENMIAKVLITFFLVIFALTIPAHAQELAPDFTLTDIDGNEFSLSNFRGKIVLLNFFAVY